MTPPKTRWLLFTSFAATILILFAGAALLGGEGQLLLPLDDVYIHFQYARQLALGEPYVYNPGGVPTSGATSFLYPYVLAVGYLIGFQGLNLGWWALLVGAAALLASLLAIHRLCRAFASPNWLAWLTTLAFGLSGSIAWHFMSGMETGLMMAFTLWTLVFFVERRLSSFVIAATLLALTRPEGSIMAAGAAILMVAQMWRGLAACEKYPPRRWQLIWLLLPIAAVFAQPLVNDLVTGSSVATGNQSKSLLAMVPHDWSVILTRIVENFGRIWWEFFTGYAPNEGWYLLPGLGLLATGCAVTLLFRREWRWAGLLLLGWMLALAAAISTLDTAFWHFKRYQMPLLALAFPLSAWAITSLLSRRDAQPIRLPRIGVGASYIMVLGFAAVLLGQFWNYHRINVSYVYRQPYQMALWLRENTPEGALVAVHDVGLMRYAGERDTLDFVGLTTPGAAAYWRNGPGAVAEFLLNQQPDYIASYGVGHGYGLRMLADTALYENVQVQFIIEDWQPHLNVALAAASQGIYQPDWDTITQTDTALSQCQFSPYALADSSTYGHVDAGDVMTEVAVNYAWQSDVSGRFPTEVRQFGDLLDAYRLIDGEESFTVAWDDRPRPIVLISYVHAQYAGTLDIYVNETLIDTRWIPEEPGELEIISTLLQPEHTTDELRIRIVPQLEDGYYMPICHTVRDFAEYDDNSAFSPDDSDLSFLPPEEPVATYQNSAFWLVASQAERNTAGELAVDLDWYVSQQTASGDYKLFVHLYDDTTAPPLAQSDVYVAEMPVGNWLPGGINTAPALTLSLDDLQAGTYQLAIGFYNPNDPLDRLIPESDSHEVTSDGRLWLAEVVID